MRIDHEGLSLWYGTPDSPAPEGEILSNGNIAITIGVSPADAGNSVNIIYRVNQGPPQTIATKWLRGDPARKTQYFGARFPDFRLVMEKIRRDMEKRRSKPFQRRIRPCKAGRHCSRLIMAPMRWFSTMNRTLILMLRS